MHCTSHLADKILKIIHGTNLCGQYKKYGGSRPIAAGRLEPVGMFRSDGKRSHGISLIPLNKANCLVLDAICVDTLAASYIHSTKVKAGGAAETAVLKKETYKRLLEKIIPTIYR